MTNAADGIYFGMAEETYHALPRLSASGFKNLRISPATFWAESWLNPAPKELTDEQQRRLALAKLLGSAYHCARLEPDQLTERYCRMLDKADFADVPGFLAGGTAYGDALGALGQTKKKAGESVQQQASRLEQVVKDLAAAGELPEGFTPGPIWDVELAIWEDSRGTRTPIPAINWDEILTDMERLQLVPEIHELLSGGFAEVTILWTDKNGLPMKTRLDYLTAGGWVDFKTFSNGVGKNVRNVISEAFMYNRHHIQAAVQREAVELLRTSQLPVHGEPDEAAKDMLALIQLAPGELDCHYVYQEKSGVPNLWARKLRFFDVPDAATYHHAGASEEGKAAVEAGRRTDTVWFRKAKMEIRVAKRDFVEYSAVYPAGHPWLPFDPVSEFSDADFRSFWLEEDVN